MLYTGHAADYLLAGHKMIISNGIFSPFTERSSSSFPRPTARQSPVCQPNGKVHCIRRQSPALERLCYTSTFGFMLPALDGVS